MNKRQRKKQEKKLVIERPNIEVGDTVEVVHNSWDGQRVGTVGFVVKVSETLDGKPKAKVTHGLDINDRYALRHPFTDLKLIKKGTNL